MADVLRCVVRALGQVRAHGGLRASAWKILRDSDLKTGTLVGEDKYGNRYFENQAYFFGRNRWVEYTNEMNGKNTYWDLDGSMVPPEWHGWLHYITDEAPSVHPPVSRPFIWETHQINLTGTAGQYVPFSTTRKKVHQWVPPQSSSR